MLSIPEVSSEHGFCVGFGCVDADEKGGGCDGGGGEEGFGDNIAAAAGVVVAASNAIFLCLAQLDLSVNRVA